MRCCLARHGYRLTYPGHDREVVQKEPCGLLSGGLTLEEMRHKLDDGDAVLLIDVAVQVLHTLRQ